MNIDKTNFIKYIATLSAKDKSTCLENIWADAFPGIEIFAVGVMQEIIKRKTPYVFSIEGGYGTGKTFFSTRFSEYLKKEEINNIYFSAWESDYMPDPFLSFSKAITQFIEKDNLVCEDDINLSKLKKAVFKGLGNVISSINMEVAIPTVTKIRISGKALVNNWSKTSKESDDPILNMQKSLKDIITKLKNSKLVLIVDELDRCRPDYAVKTLETVKHFFDIEGIIVIFPVHRDKLNEYINGFYNLNSNKNNEETYLQKFISNEGDFKIPPPKYEYLCNDVLLEEVFRDCSNIKLEGESYNSLFQLKKWLAEYGKKSKLTSREFKEVIGNAIIICKSNKIGKVRCNYLSSLLCKKKYKEKGNVHLGLLHHYNPFYKDIDNPYHTSSYKVLLDCSNIISLGDGIIRISNNSIINDRDDNFKNETIDFRNNLEAFLINLEAFNYTDKNKKSSKLIDILKTLKKDKFLKAQKSVDKIKNFSISNLEINNLKNNLQRCGREIEEKIAEIEEFLDEYGCCDEIDKIIKKYTSIIEERYKLHIEEKDNS